MMRIPRPKCIVVKAGEAKKRRPKFNTQRKLNANKGKIYKFLRE